jgi:RNA polymerase sigma-70 factor (ECF subfamily)
MKSLNKSEIQQLTQKLKIGDLTAFNALFYFFEPKVFAYSMKLTHNVEESKEAVQEVFLKIWERREWIDPECNFDSFLFTIAKNLIYNRAKHRAYVFAYQKYITLYSTQTENFTENTVEFNELDSLIQTACRRLPPVRREIFRLSRVEGLSNSEIAEKLNTSTSNVKNHIYKAILFLKDKLRVNEVISLVLLFLF